MTATDEVLDLFATFGSSKYDEGVTLTDHSLQTAALATANGGTGNTRRGSASARCWPLSRGPAAGR